MADARKNIQLNDEFGQGHNPNKPLGKNTSIQYYQGSLSAIFIA